MGRYFIEIDETKVQEQIAGILNDILNKEINRKYSYSGEVIAMAIKDLVYSRKDEIIGKVIDKESKEIVKKGLPKLIEKFED